MADDQDLDLQLLSGDPIEIDRVGTLYIPTVRQITKIKNSIHNQYLSALLFNKASIAGMEETEADEFDLLFAICYQNAEFRRLFFQAVQFYFKEEAQLGSDDAGFFFGFANSDRRIDKSNFVHIQHMIRKANYIKSEKNDDYKAANLKAQAMIELILRNKRNWPQKKENINLHSIVSGLAWKPNGMNIKDIFDLTIYQIYNGFFATESIDHYEHTFTGIYTGNVDSKTINFAKIHWAKILENN